MRLVRLIAEVSDYNLKFTYRPGKLNDGPDYLPRNPIGEIGMFDPGHHLTEPAVCTHPVMFVGLTLKGVMVGKQIITFHIIHTCQRRLKVTHNRCYCLPCLGWLHRELGICCYNHKTRASPAPLESVVCDLAHPSCAIPSCLTMCTQILLISNVHWWILMPKKENECCWTDK